LDFEEKCKIMLCYICGRICDPTPRGLCVDCEREIALNDERVMMTALLDAAQVYCPVWLREKIENVLHRVNKKEPVIP
jgi:hypothetical protein